MRGNPEDEALNKILGDMDGMESDRMFGAKPGDASKGVSITISVVPNGEEPDADDMPGMNKGGMMPGYAKGGMVEGNAPTQMPAEAALEDKTLPPFLRKKKKSAPSI